MWETYTQAAVITSAILIGWLTTARLYRGSAGDACGKDGLDRPLGCGGCLRNSPCLSGGSIQGDNAQGQQECSQTERHS